MLQDAREDIDIRAIYLNVSLCKICPALPDAACFVYFASSCNFCASLPTTRHPGNEVELERLEISDYFVLRQ